VDRSGTESIRPRRRARFPVEAARDHCPGNRLRHRRRSRVRRGWHPHAGRALRPPGARDRRGSEGELAALQTRAYLGGDRLRPGQGFGRPTDCYWTVGSANLGRVAARDLVTVQVISRVAQFRSVEVGHIRNYLLEQTWKRVYSRWLPTTGHDQAFEILFRRLMGVEGYYVRQLSSTFVFRECARCTQVTIRESPPRFWVFNRAVHRVSPHLSPPL